VWLDDYASPTPRIEALWIANVPSDSSTIELFNVAPDTVRADYSPTSGDVSHDKIQGRTQTPFGGTLTLDRHSLRDLIDELGGIFVAGQKMDGASVIAYLTANPTESTQAVLIRQCAVMQGLLAQAAVLGKDLNLPAVLKNWSHITVDETVLLDMINQHYPFHIEMVRTCTPPPPVTEAPP
jgi:hypothetical protein